jgi:hypothetical protein
MPSLIKSFLGFVLIASIGLAAGCKQDPLDGFDQSVRKAVPPNTKPEPEISPGDIVIDVADFYDVKEGDTLSFGINGAVLIPGHTFTISIRNPEAFPGLEFDSASSTVTWKAPTDFVKSTDFDVVQMTIVLATNEAPFIFGEKAVQIRVFRNIERPEIISIEKLVEPVAEGSAKSFQVVVKSLDEVSKPLLSIVRTQSGKDGAIFMLPGNSPTQDKTDPSLWTFEVRIDLYDAEATNELDILSFGVQARSSLGVLSTVVEGEFEVINRLAQPLTTWDNSPEAELTAGQRNVFSFVVYDPKFEGEIDLDVTQLCRPFPGAKCSCDKVKTGLLQCSIDWTPAGPGYFVVRMYVYNRMTIKSKNYNESLYLNRAIKVVKGSTP